MDRQEIFEGQHRALLRLVAALVSLAGTAVAVALPPGIRRAILRVLRPAEAAGRRLVVVAAEELSVPAPAQRQAPSAPIPKGNGAAVPCFALFDPRKRFAASNDGARMLAGYGPRIDGIALTEPSTPEGREPSDARVMGRLLALHAALEDIPKQARRLARVLARRRAADEIPRRTSPLRPGFPPGHRQRQTHQVDGILAECDLLARRVLAPG